MRPQPDMPRIVIDTREQRPWEFPDYVQTVIGTLPTGDYALEGDRGFAIERKSLDDFVGTLFSGWERFQREIGRMEGAAFAAKVIIVEADYASLMFCRDASGQIVAPMHRHPLITPQAMAGRIADLTMMGVSMLFCRDSGHAALQAYMLLTRRAAQLKAVEPAGKNGMNYHLGSINGK